MWNQSLSNLLIKLISNIKKNDETMNIGEKDIVSLGLAPLEILGFKSKDHLNEEISKLIKIRTKFATKATVKSN